MTRLAALCLLLAAAPAGGQASRPMARVSAALAAGDSSRAYQLARDASRARLDDADLARTRLWLEMEGHATETLASRVRHQQLVDVGRRLLRLSPADTVALRALSADALWTVLSRHDRRASTPIRFTSHVPYWMRGPRTDDAEVGARRVDESAGEYAISGVNEFVSRAEARGRTQDSRFDLAARERVAPSLDGSGPAREARALLDTLLPTWRTAAPDDDRPYAVGLVAAAVETDWAGLLAAARAFRAARPGSAEPLLYLGLAHLRQGDLAEADAAFAEAFERLPDSAQVRYSDLIPLLTPDEAEAYAADPDGFAEAYWTDADPRLLTPANERRTEHRARVVEADLLFGFKLLGLYDLFGLRLWPPTGSETEQGRVWVRYGRPERIQQLQPHAQGTPTYGAGADALFAVWEYPDFRYVFNNTLGEYALFAPPASAFSGSDALTAQNDDYVMQDRRFRRERPTQTQITPTFSVPLLVSRFRQPGGGTEAVVAYGLPLADAGRQPAEVEVGVFTLDGGRLVAEKRRPLRAGAGRVLTAGGATVWADATTVALPDASPSVRAEMGVGDAWGVASLALAPLPAAGFGLSDLLLATSVDVDAGGRGGVVRDGLSLAPAPWGVFGTGDPIVVYVEAYGLGLTGGQTQYNVEAALMPEDTRGVVGRLLGRGRGAGVAVQSSASGDRPDEAVVLTLDASDQPPGRYTLALRLTDRVTGQTAEVTREVLLE